MESLGLIFFLAFLESILSIDNALVLAMLAKRLDPHQRKKALTYGLVGAVVFRLIALSLVTVLIHWRWLKIIGGLYLLFIAVQYYLTASPNNHSDPNTKTSPRHGFWRTVLAIELTDLAFALDSLLAAVALTDVLWVVFVGTFIGVIAVRFAASYLVRLLERFPRLEATSFQLVLTIGLKVTIEGVFPESMDFHSTQSPLFWFFWGLMLLITLLGFVPRRRRGKLAP